VALRCALDERFGQVGLAGQVHVHVASQQRWRGEAGQSATEEPAHV
jgi:hypothetical protein